MKNKVEIKESFNSVSDFYPFYLTQHLNPICRNLHIFGTVTAVIFSLFVILKGKFTLLLISPIIGYGFSWIGHFIFEKNKPAAFDYFWLSFKCDFLMVKDYFFGVLDQKVENAKMTLFSK